MENRPTITRQAYQWAQGASVAWQVFVFFFPVAGAAMTGWLARTQEIPVPWFLVIFYSSGVFMFLAVAAISLMRGTWELTLKHKITCDDFSLQIIPESQNKVGIVLQSFFNNLSYMPVQVTLSDISISIQSKTTAQMPQETILRSISANSFVPITWPPIRDIDIRSPADGFLKFTAKYGPVGKKQNRTYTTTFSLHISLSKTKDGYLSQHHIWTEAQSYS
jgi:hypothetical protein